MKFTSFIPSLLFLMVSLVESSSTQQRLGDATGSVHVRLSVEFDNFPAESSFKLISVADGAKEVVVDRPVGTFTSPGGLYEEDIFLLPGLYELEFRDSVGDGICCAFGNEFGNGGYELRTIIDNDGNDEGVEGVVLVASTGKFGDLEVSQFTVDEPAPSAPTTSSSPTPSPVDEAPTTSSPTPSPAAGSTPPTPQQPTSVSSGCIDDAEGLVYIDADVGEKNCEWIVLNMIRYSYLCHFLDVAVTCKATCSACEYFV